MEPLLSEDAEPAAPARRRSRRERRIRSKVRPDERFVAWGRGWMSRDGRLRAVLAARTYDFVLLSDRRLYLVTTGFFSRQPRRVVYVIPLDRLRVTERPRKRGRELQITAIEQATHVIELPGTPRNNLLADALLEAALRPQPDAQSSG